MEPILLRESGNSEPIRFYGKQLELKFLLREQISSPEFPECNWKSSQNTTSLSYT